MAGASSRLSSIAAPGEVLGHGVERNGRAKTVERAPEEALLQPRNMIEILHFHFYRHG